MFYIFVRNNFMGKIKVNSKVSVFHELGQGHGQGPGAHAQVHPKVLRDEGTVTSRWTAHPDDEVESHNGRGHARRHQGKCSDMLCFCA